ncbi:uncharacterized protein LOC126899954 [Daktulosphaira vitifoliae]|uniref:uncharacterized protein LOC126899954 n=1 Tax=Daktulosphaira vitifoliae TaxID=58002 RepID=UPI0021A99C57|nr:uncharacterized protein LOC126899954 [Daktulosphaira vitifoliae]
MKIFMTEMIILLVILQRGGIVLTSSEVPKDLTGFTDLQINTNEPDNCPICFADLMDDVSQTICCKKIFHSECLDYWIDQPRNCPNCLQKPFKECKLCGKFLHINLTNMKCCNSQFHNNCLDEWFSKSNKCPGCNTKIPLCKLCRTMLLVDVTNMKCCESQFHNNCLDEWFTKSIACPKCNTMLLPQCILCKKFLHVDVTNLNCCKSKVHQKCLDIWLTESIGCPACNEELISDYDKTFVCSDCKNIRKKEDLIKMKCCDINLCTFCIERPRRTSCLCGRSFLEENTVCHKCETVRNVILWDSVVMNCCGKRLCNLCINNKMRIRCLCGNYLAEGIPSEPERKCTACKKNIGIYTFSPRCPQIYCKRCFIDMEIRYKCCKYCSERKAWKCCIYCNEEKVKDYL